MGRPRGFPDFPASNMRVPPSNNHKSTSDTSNTSDAPRRSSHTKPGPSDNPPSPSPPGGSLRAVTPAAWRSASQPSRQRSAQAVPLRSTAQGVPAQRRHLAATQPSAVCGSPATGAPHPSLRCSAHNKSLRSTEPRPAAPVAARRRVVVRPRHCSSPRERAAASNGRSAVRAYAPTAPSGNRPDKVVALRDPRRIACGRRRHHHVEGSRLSLHVMAEDAPAFHLRRPRPRTIVDRLPFGVARVPSPLRRFAVRYAPQRGPFQASRQAACLRVSPAKPQSTHSGCVPKTGRTGGPNQRCSAYGLT